MGITTLVIHAVWIAWAVAAWRALFPAPARGLAPPVHG
jgi:hypothetical protein